MDKAMFKHSRRILRRVKRDYANRRKKVIQRILKLAEKGRITDELTSLLQKIEIIDPEWTVPHIYPIPEGYWDEMAQPYSFDDCPMHCHPVNRIHWYQCHLFNK